MKKVEITDDYRKKKLQRALLQYNRPENRALVAEALKEAGREDLIGYGKECLIRPPTNQGPKPSGNKTKIGSSSKDRRVQRPNPQARSGAQSTRKPKRNKTN
jgi:hypothetical protein